MFWVVFLMLSNSLLWILCLMLKDNSMLHIVVSGDVSLDRVYILVGALGYNAAPLLPNAIN